MQVGRVLDKVSGRMLTGDRAAAAGLQPPRSRPHQPTRHPHPLAPTPYFCFRCLSLPPFLFCAPLPAPPLMASPAPPLLSRYQRFPTHLFRIPATTPLVVSALPLSFPTALRSPTSISVSEPVSVPPFSWSGSPYPSLAQRPLCFMVPLGQVLSGF